MVPRDGGWRVRSKDRWRHAPGHTRTHAQGHTSHSCRDPHHTQALTDTGSDPHLYRINAHGHTHIRNHTEGSQSQPELCMLQLSPNYTRAKRSAQTQLNIDVQTHKGPHHTPHTRNAH